VRRPRRGENRLEFVNRERQAKLLRLHDPRHSTGLNLNNLVMTTVSIISGKEVGLFDSVMSS